MNNANCSPDIVENNNMEEQEIDDSNMEEEENPMKRWVKTGTKNGWRSLEQKNRIVEAARKSEDWRSIASANCVPIATAYGWIIKSGDAVIPTERKRGGARNNKVTLVHKQKMIQYVENAPLIITLVEIKHKLQRDQGIMLSITTTTSIWNTRFIQLKKFYLNR